MKQVDNIKTRKSKNYNKTLVVGHALCENDCVLNLLSASGMSLAKHSKKENISASEISTTLLKTHNAEGDDIEQLEINQVWDGLALDLLMNNIDQKWWGWADSNAVSLLYYWKSLDSKMAFILVYDTPQNFVKQILNNLDFISSFEFQNIIDEWCNYNKALLKFYYRNPERSLLVNSQQVKVDSVDYLQQVGKQIGIKDANISDNAITTIQKSFQNEENDDPLLSYLVKDLLEEHTDIVYIFEELQSVANLPFNAIEKIKDKSLDAIFSLIKEKQNKVVLTTNLESQKRLYNELIEIEKQKSSENKLLLTQLMQVQENLEKLYINKMKVLLKQSFIHEVKLQRIKRSM